MEKKFDDLESARDLMYATSGIPPGVNEIAYKKGLEKERKERRKNSKKD